MNSFLTIIAIIGMFVTVGMAIGLTDRKNFDPRWLLVAAALVFINDFMLVRGYGALPRLLEHTNWNWQGKLLALASTLIVVSLPAFGWKQAGFTLTQKTQGWLTTMSVVIIVAALYIGLALSIPNEPSDLETIAFQMTLPGLEEEAFYTGILLFALNKSYAARVRFLGVDWGWSALLVACLFGLAHAFSYSQGHFSFDWITMLSTAGPAPIVYWLRMRTGSILLPVCLHNFGNSISLFL